MPIRTVWFLFKVRAGDELLREILRIVNQRLYNQILLPVGLLDRVEIFCHQGIRAVRYSILAQIAGSEPRGHHFKRSSRAGWPKSTARLVVPGCNRVTLPLQWSGL